MAQITIVLFRFVVFFFIVLCFCCEVLECSSSSNSNKHYRRHDVHRIVIKPKRKASYKKPYSHLSHLSSSSSSHDYHHYPMIQEEMFDPYHAEPSHHLDSSPIMDDPIQYMASHHGFSTRYREPERYKDYSKDRMRYPSYKPSSLQNYEFESLPYKPGYPEYKNYREMMEEYNRKQEEEFRRQLEKAKMQMHFAQHQQHLEQQQQHQMRGQDMFHYGESQERPIWNAPEDNGMIKGDWSPMSHSESPSYISPSYTKPSTFDLPLSTTPQTSQYIDLTKLDMTTSKPQRLSPIISAKNSTKNGNGGKQKVNYNFNTNYFPNHKPDHFKSNENDVINNNNNGNVDDNNKTKDLKEFQPSPVVSTSYSTLWGNNNNNDQNENENIDANNSNKYQTTAGSYGTKTKIRRTKRPATYGNH